MIQVTTPSGTVNQVPGGFAKADRERREKEQREREGQQGIFGRGGRDFHASGIPSSTKDEWEKLDRDRAAAVAARQQQQAAAAAAAAAAGAPPPSDPALQAPPGPHHHHHHHHHLASRSGSAASQLEAEEMRRRERAGAGGRGGKKEDADVSMTDLSGQPSAPVHPQRPGSQPPQRPGSVGAATGPSGAGQQQVYPPPMSGIPPMPGSRAQTPLAGTAYGPNANSVAPAGQQPSGIPFGNTNAGGRMGGMLPGQQPPQHPGPLMAHGGHLPPSIDASASGAAQMAAGAGSGPSTPGAAQLLASGMGTQSMSQHQQQQQQQQHQAAAAQQQQQQQLQEQLRDVHERPAQMVEFNHAIAFVNKIKNRFSSDPETYKQFLEILQTYQKETKDINEVYSQVTVLFDNAPDLLDEFSQFLPGADGQQGSGGLFGDLFGGLGGQQPMPGAGGAGGAAAGPDKSTKRASKGDKDSGASVKDAAVGGSRKKRGVDKDGKATGGRSKKSKASHHRDDGASVNEEHMGPPAQGQSYHHHHLQHAGHPSQQHQLQSQQPLGPTTLASQNEVVFFERVKKQIDDRVTYHEFLKLLNLFVNDIVDTKTLVERAAVFLGGDQNDLFREFKALVGYPQLSVDANGHIMNPPVGMINLDPYGVAENLPMLQRPKVDLNNQRASGPSYRKLPKAEVNLACSGRDPMCWEVLNDEWVSHPTWASEDAVPSAAHKRNAYEEALHKTEEERHEYDYHVEANIRTIALLEPLNARIKEMDEVEKAQWRLKPGLGGQSKSIYQRILKKIYGREQGLEVIAALHEQPAMAIPVVLARLKQKDEEWKKAQREWNKVWREVDAKNFYKSLDHQGVVFKAADKKALAVKTLLAEVEALRKEQTQKQAASGEPVALSGFERGQYKFAIEDIDCLQDALKLSFSYLDRMTLAAADRNRVEAFIRTFVPLFFQFDAEEYDPTFGELANGQGDEDSEMGDGMSDAGSLPDDDDGRSSATGRRGRGKADLRTKLLRQVVQSGERGGKRAGSATPAPSESGAGSENGGSDVAMGDTHTNGDAMSLSDEKIVEDEDVAASRSAMLEGERTWVAIDPTTQNPPAPVDGADVLDKQPQRYTFFGNNHYFCFFRVLQVSRARLFRLLALFIG